MFKQVWKKDRRWSPLAFWLEVAFIVLFLVLVLYKGPDRIDLVIGLLLGFVWGHRVTKEPCIFKRMVLRRKCDSSE